MPAFTRLEIWTNYQARGGTVVCDVPDLVECGATFNVEQPEQESLHFAVPVTSRVASQLTPRRVARAVFSDGTFDEWRFNVDSTKPLGGDGNIAFTALPPIFMLAECGYYYTTGAGGVRSFAYAAVDITPSAALSAYVLGAPDTPACFALGTITPTVLISISGTRKTPLAIALEIRDACRAKGVACELRVRRNGTTQYLIDLVTSVGSAASVPEIRASKQMIDYTLTHDCTKQATRVLPFGPVDSSGVEATLARARFTVTAVNGGTKRLTLADEAGGGGPIVYNEQYLGWFLFREKTGRTFQVVHSYAATQEIEVADVSNFAAHSATTPEWVSFRLTEALNGTRRLGQFTAGTKVALLNVTAVNGGTKELTLANDFSNFADPVKADSEHVDWKARRASLVLATSSTGQTGSGSVVLTCGSVAGVAANDICIVSTGVAGGPWPLYQAVGLVDSVNGGANQVTMHARESDATPLSAWGGGPLTVRFYRPVATQHLITASVASTDIITVDAVGTAAVNDLLEILQPCQGTLPFYVESASDITTYDKKIADLARPETGETNGFVNSCMRTWSNPANPPDGWTRVVNAGAPTHSKNTDPTYTRMGGASWLVQLDDGVNRSTVYTPPAFVHPIIGATNASVRVKVWIVTLPGASKVDFALEKIDRGGTVISTVATAGFVGLSYGAPPANYSAVQVGAWAEVAFNAVDLSQFGNELLRVRMNTAGAMTCTLYIDGAQWTQTPTAPQAEPDLLIEFSESTKLLQAGNLELLSWAAPPVEFAMSLVDIHAVDPTTFAEDQITIGGNVRAMDPDRSVDLTLRLMQWSPDYLAPERGSVTLSKLPTLLTNLIAA